MQRMRNRCVSAVVVLLALSAFDHSVQAFAPAQSRVTTSRARFVAQSTMSTFTAPSFGSATTATPTSTSLALSIGWEDVVYHAESVASNLASLSLNNDPSNLVTSFPVMYGAGLLTSFSPCVWGLLPLTMSYISNAAGERQDQQTTLPTLAFAAGLAVVFCSLGVLSAQLGGVFGSSNGGGGSDSLNVMGMFSNLVVFLMGLQLLEIIQVPLPSLDFLRDQVSPLNGSTTNPQQPILLDGTGQILDSNQKQSRQEGGGESGSLFRTFLLGGSSALVASPCATPVLTSILAFVAKTQNPLLGGALLLGYTLGYSTPLLLLASTGGQALVDLRQRANKEGGLYATLAPWVTPLTGGILLWYGTNGFLTAVLGDPSLAGLQVLE